MRHEYQYLRKSIRGNGLCCQQTGIMALWLIWFQKVALICCITIITPMLHDLSVIRAASDEPLQQSEVNHGRSSSWYVDSRMTATWDRQLLGIALEQITRHQHAAIWLDRRIDPSRPLSLSVRGERLQETLEKIASVCNLSIIQWSACTYLGPEKGVQTLITVEQRLQKELNDVAPAWRSRWLSKSSWKWPRLSQPRELIRMLFAGTGIKVEGLEQIPFDLWPARVLPSMSRVDRATLILVGFNLAPSLLADGSKCRIVPISIDWTSKYEEGTKLDTYQSNHPTQQEIRQPPSIRQLRRRSARSPVQVGPAEGQQLLTLRVREKPVRVILQELSRQLGLEFKWDKKKLAESGHSLDVRISCAVEQASVEQLLEAVLKPVGLRARREMKVIHIEVD